MAAIGIASRSTSMRSIFRNATTRNLISHKPRLSVPNPNFTSPRFNTTSRIEGSLPGFLRRELSTNQPFHSTVAAACLVSKLPSDVTSPEELLKMGYKEDLPAVRVYTVCDESRYLIVRNVPALGCGDDLMRLFKTYGEVEECKPMDAEDCAEFTDVYWIKFRLITNARFAKRKLDESVFLGNRLQISYAPEFESPCDTKDKLETRRKEVLSRLNPEKAKTTSQVTKMDGPALTQTDNFSPHRREMEYQFHRGNAPISRVSSDQEYFASSSMNKTVQTVREKLNKIEESGNQKRLQEPSSQTQPDFKRTRVDNRRRI